MTAVWVLLATLAAATVAGLYLRARNGRIRSTGRSAKAELPTAVANALEAETPVTLVQLSTTFCAPCRHARAVFGQLAEHTAGLAHADLDVTQRPEIARELGVLRTPTTLALDHNGRELLRVDGVPKGAEVLDALRPHLPAARPTT